MHRNESGNLKREIYAIHPEQWVIKYADYLYAYAVRRINDDELSKDLVQETFLAALEKVEKFEGRSSEKTWLTAILKNKICDIYHKKCSLAATKNNSTPETECVHFFRIDDGHWNPEHRPKAFEIEDQLGIEKKEFNQILEQCLKKLPALWLSVFKMKHLEDYTAEIICCTLKVTPANFWVIIHRAKLNLRACLQKNWHSL